MKNNNSKVAAIKAIHDVRAAQYKMKYEQDWILEQNKLYYESEKSKERVWDNFASSVNKKLEEDIKNVNCFNQIISQYKEPLSYGIKFNKMSQILQEVLEYSKLNENFMGDLAQGKTPHVFDNNIEVGKLPTLGGGDFWGSSKSTVLSAAASFINMITNNKSLKKTLDLQKSSIAHAFELPEVVKNEDLNNYIYKSENNKKYFSFFHSGYSFGGARGDEKKFAPQHCGSFIEKVCLLGKLAPKATATTADLLCAHRYGSNEFIPQEWDKNSFSLVKLFSTNKDEQNIIGSVYVNRMFDENYPELTSLGKGGHTAIILGLNKQKEFVTIGVNRDMPKVEGYGLQNFSSDCTDKNKKSYSKIYILDPSEPITNSLQKDFSHVSYNSLDDLRSVVENFDKELKPTGEILEEITDF